MGGASVMRTVQVCNGRGNDDLTFDEASFELVTDCPTALSKSDFYKIQEGTSPDLVDKYHQEVEAFVKAKLGCDRVVCFHSQVRNAAIADGDSSSSGGVQGYAGGGPHTDSSPISADELALQTIQDGDGTTKFERYCYANLWRNISDDPIEDNHLAMLDERTTVKPDDYIPRDLFGDGYSVVQYGLNARHASNHKWYYYPKMTKNEAIVFKQMDSDWTKSGRICFHMSVSDSSKLEQNLPPRESIELRMMCFWKDADVDSMPTKENINASLIQDPVTITKINSWLESLITAVGILLFIISFGYIRVGGGLGCRCKIPRVTNIPANQMITWINLRNSYNPTRLGQVLQKHG